MLRSEPKTPKEQVEAIAKANLVMKGASAKRNKDAHEKGLLRIKTKPLIYRGSAATWKHLAARHEDWTTKPAPPLD